MFLSQKMVLDPPFLFDVDLFAIDVYINSIYLIEWEEAEDGSTKWTNRFEYINKNDQANITGLLDMPYTKPTHLGYDLGSDSYHTNIKIDPFKQPKDLRPFFEIETSLNSVVSIKDDVESGDLPPVGEMTIPIANIDYIKHDVELLERLQLRKGTKLEKDRQRLKLLARYDKIKTIDLDEELHAVETQTNYENIKVSLWDVATLRVAHIIKYLAVPKFSPDNTQPYGFIECPDSVQYEVVFDTFTRFDYKESSWITCCDIIPNMFKFRYDSKQLRNWSKDNDQKNSVLCILKSWKKYLIKIEKLPVDKNRLLYIGVMLYGFRPDFLDNPNVAKNPKYFNNLFIDNILI